jgi:hypothetical protein
MVIEVLGRTHAIRWQILWVKSHSCLDGGKI